jgi:uncharacterized protein (TIGR01777 family)
VAEEKRLKTAMSGATGFVGTHLRKGFEYRGWEVVPLGRDDFRGDKDKLAGRIEGSDVVVNLAGAPIIARWSRSYKEELYASRIETTGKILDALENISKKPEVFISASAVGIYAAGGTHTEDEHALSDDFLGMLARDWEREALRAGDLGIRTVVFRFGVVLGRDGGALQAMLPPFRAGVGGTVGDGSQQFSWVHIDDLINAYFTAMEDRRFEGVYNLTAPNPTTNRELTKTLAKVLNRPAVLRVPQFVLRLQYGEGAQVLTKGQRVIPRRLLEGGFEFRFPEIEGALRDLVKP